MNKSLVRICRLPSKSLYLHGILFLAACLSLQQKHETPQAITIIKMTETQPTMRSSFRLIWQFLPANQGRHSHLTFDTSSKIHLPFLLHKSHSVVVAVIQKNIMKIWGLSLQYMGWAIWACSINIFFVSQRNYEKNMLRRGFVDFLWNKRHSYGLTKQRG